MVVSHAGRLDAVLVDLLEGVSRSRVAALIRDGSVLVDEKVVRKPSSKVAIGMVVIVSLPSPEPSDAKPQDIPVRIVYEDEHLAVIDKAPGMVVHPGPGHHDGTLVNALLFHLSGLSGIGGTVRPGIVHRLDKGTSGLLVVAKHDEAHHGLARQFAEHTAGRRYVALVHGQPKERAGRIETMLARHPTDRLRWASTSDERVGKLAVTHWKVLGVQGTLSLVECRLETGRTHQIRVHLTELGHPLVGDPTYTRRRARAPASIREQVGALGARPLLHAWALTLEHPITGRAMRFIAHPPLDMMGILRRCSLAEVLPGDLQSAP